MLKNLQRGGYNVVLNAKLYDEKVIDLSKELEKEYLIECMVCFGDVANEEDVLRMLSEVNKRFGTLDVLVNNAAIVKDMELDSRTVEIFEETMHNNVTGVYLMCKHFGKFMFGLDKITRIINVSSTNGINTCFPTSIDYDASKAAVISLTHNFAIKYAPKILVNSVAPGWINTEMNADMPSDIIKEETSKIYLKRFAEPEEIASLVYYLGSDANTYINNEVITIDGGY